MLLLSIAIVPTVGVPTVGTLLVLTGILIRLVIGNRRFVRRGVGGLQQFRSYWAGMLVSFFEWVFSLAALGLILSGLLLLLIHWYNQH